MKKTITTQSPTERRWTATLHPFLPALGQAYFQFQKTLLSFFLLHLPKQPNHDIPKTVEYVPAQHCLQMLEEAAPVITLSDQNSFKASRSRTNCLLIGKTCSVEMSIWLLKSWKKTILFHSVITGGLEYSDQISRVCRATMPFLTTLCCSPSTT